MIEIQQLTKSLRGGGHRVDILTGIDLTIPDGQFVAITGPSGSGKTTLLSLIAGLDAPTGGSILVDGEDITKLNEDELALLRGRRLGFVIQNFHLIPTLTAIENVILAAELTGASSPHKKSEDLLGVVGLGDRFTITHRNSPAANSKDYRWRAHSSMNRTLYWRTSRPATSTPKTADAFLT